MSTVHPSKPCRKCGESDRTPGGRCRPCQRERNRKTREARKRGHSCPDCGNTVTGTGYYCSPCGRKRRQTSAQQKNDAGTPCEQCGAVDWELASGQCRPCKAEATRKRRECRIRNQEPCAKCGHIDWNKQGVCQECHRRGGPSRAAHPCKVCGSTERYDSGPCIPCTLKRRRELGKERTGQPCEVCGAQEWSIYGICRNCQRERERVLAAQKIRDRTPCNRCGRVAWMPSGRCLRCDRKTILKRARRRRAAGEPCKQCGQVEWMPSGKCSVCDRAYRAKHRAKHPERVRRQVQAASIRRRARKKQAGGTITSADIKARYAAQKGRCWWCHGNVGDTYHIDHVIPLARGGGNGPDNIVVSCATCNLSKGTKLPVEFAGRLF